MFLHWRTEQSHFDATKIEQQQLLPVENSLSTSANIAISKSLIATGNGMLVTSGRGTPRTRPIHRAASRPAALGP